MELLDLFMAFLGMDLDNFLAPEETFIEEPPLFIELLMAFFLMPAEVDIFRDVDLRGIRFPFTVDGIRALGSDLNPETFIFLPLLSFSFIFFGICWSTEELA